MPISNAFASSRLRLQWAKESVSGFKRSSNTYFKRTPCRVRIDPDPDGVHERHKLVFDKPLPSALTKFTVRAVEDARFALDLAACDVARLVRPKGSSVDDVYFPFCKAKTDFKSRINGACKNFPKEITDVFARYEPYGGGSDLLVAMNDLCNSSKHRLVAPVASIVGTKLPHIESYGGTLPIRLIEGYSSAENEITFAIAERGLKWKYNARFAFRICFGKIEKIPGHRNITGHEVLPNLEEMIRAVTLIINETEAKSRELGLLS